MLTDEFLGLREGQGEVQEQRRLQQPGHHVRPVDALVEHAPVPHIMEGVENEGDQAKDVKMGGLRGAPASQQNIQANAKIDQGDKAQADVERFVRRHQDDGHIQRDFVAHQGISSAGPDAHAEAARRQLRNGVDGLVIDGDQFVALLDARFLSRTVRQDPLGTQPSFVLHPPDAVVRNLGLHLLAEVQHRADDRREGQKAQQHGRKADLELALHERLRRSHPPTFMPGYLIRLQLRFQDSARQDGPNLIAC